MSGSQQDHSKACSDYSELHWDALLIIVGVGCGNVTMSAFPLVKQDTGGFPLGEVPVVSVQHEQPSGHGVYGLTVE
jgi:hypothetical protein